MRGRTGRWTRRNRNAFSEVHGKLGHAKSFVKRAIWEMFESKRRLSPTGFEHKAQSPTRLEKRGSARLAQAFSSAVQPGRAAARRTTGQHERIGTRGAALARREDGQRQLHRR